MTHASVCVADDAATAFQSRVQPLLLKTYCTECHGGEKPKAKIDLTGRAVLEQLGRATGTLVPACSTASRPVMNMPPEGRQSSRRPSRSG